MAVLFYAVNMTKILCAIFVSLLLSASCAAQDLSLQPKYGLAPKNAAHQAADATFIAAVDQQFNGDRKAAAGQVAQMGWRALRGGNLKEAIQRFNQAWLLDNANATALWGMAAVEGSRLQFPSALKLFAEAAPEQNPQHAANLQNWAIHLFYSEDYAGAWQKIQLAEKTPGAAGLDQSFIAALSGKMARPK